MKDKHTQIIVLLSVALLLFSCQSEVKNQSVAELIDLSKIKASQVNISDFTSEMKVIQLETSNSCLVGNISNIELGRDLVYIHDGISKSIHIFDKTGKFVKKLYKEGRGPGEYMSLDCFIVDQNGGTIEILDTQQKKLLVYDINSLDLIETIAIPIGTAFGFEKKDGLYYFRTNGLRNTIGDKKTNSDIIVYNPTTQETIPLFDIVLPDEVNQSFSINGFGGNGQGGLFFSKTWQNQLYEINDTTIKAVVQIEAGSFDAPSNVKNGSYDRQEEFINTEELSRGKYLFFRLAYYNQGKMIVIFTKGTRPFDLHYYIKNTDKELLTNKIKIDNIETMPDLSIGNSFFVDDTLIYVVIPGEMQSQEMSSYLKSIGVEDNQNPILLMFKIK